MIQDINPSFSLKSSTFVEQIVSEPYPFASRALQGQIDENFIRYMTLSSLQGAEPLPRSMRTVSIVLKILNKTPIMQSPESIQYLIKALPKEVTNHPEFISVLLQNSPEAIREEILSALPEALQAGSSSRVLRNPDFIRSLIWELPDDLRDDPDYLLALMQGVSSLLNPTERLMILHTILKNASDALQQDVQFLSQMMGVAIDSSIDESQAAAILLCNIPLQLRDSFEYVVAVIHNLPSAINKLPKEDLSNPSYMRELIQYVPHALEHAPQAYRKSPSFLLSILKKGEAEKQLSPDLLFSVLQHADRSLRQKAKFVDAVLKFAPEEWLQEVEFQESVQDLMSPHMRGRSEVLMQIHFSRLNAIQGA